MTRDSRPSNVIRQQLITEGEQEAEKLLSQKMTGFLEERIVEGQEMEAVAQLPGWERVERIITEKLMRSISEGKADVTAEMTDLLRRIYTPIKLAEKAAKDLRANAEKERKDGRRSGTGRGTGGDGRRNIGRTIFGRRGGAGGKA